MKVLCIIQARMGSERLPGKVMKRILGKPMITYTLDRAKKSKYIDEIVLATSEKDSENVMVEYLTENGYKVFRGSENNVLKRYIDTANKYQGDILIRLTGDCPFIDPTIIDYVVSYYLSNSFEYVSLNIPGAFVRGLDVEVFSRKSLEKVYKIVEELEEDFYYKEHVTLYMYKHPEEFSVSRISGSELYNKDYRLCVDTEEDFRLATTIYEHFNDIYISSREVVQYLDIHPAIAAINQQVRQKQV